MSRKAFCLIGMAMALLLVFAVGTPVQAAVNGTAHETAVGGAGACSACHIPHGGGANRLWPVSPTAGTKVGIVAQLCGSCHHANEGYGASMSAAHSDNNVYAAASHGQFMHSNNLPWSSTPAVVSLTLPYADCTVNIECTSCHDVHNDTNRPFLRANINVLCAMCHNLRHFVGGADRSGTNTGSAASTWGVPNYVGDNNVGSHPVGTDITGAVSGGPSNIFLPTYMKLTDGGVSGYSLGGRLTGGSSGGVTCVTCHAVHGLQSDPDDSGNSGLVQQVNANFLVVSQASVSAAWTDPGGGSNRSVANGNGAYNALCEACHGRDAAGAAVNPAGYVGGYAVNPGGSANRFGHPIDDSASSINAGVTAFPTNWPVGGGMTPDADVDPIPICESCHVPHPRAEFAGGRADVDNNARAWIVRSPHYEGTAAATGNFCARCHTTTFAGHHPVGATFNSAGVNYLPNTTGASGDTLKCSTCHASGGAHNWAAAGALGISTGWLPTNAGRDNVVANYMYNANQSKTCMDCHYGMDGDSASKSPTLGPNANVALETAFNKAAAAANNHGTHYIGVIHDNSTTWLGTAGGATYIDFETPGSGTWRTQLGGSLLAGQGYSRFGGSDADGSRVLVCESCHNLKPSYNVGGGQYGHLLLAAYGEGLNGDDSTPGGGTTDSNGRDIFCQACHGTPAGTHQLTGMTVSRTSAVLQAPSDGGYTKAAPTGSATWRVSDGVSCDSCHQPHDAAGNSFTFILDAASGATASSSAYGDNTYVGMGTEQTGTSARGYIAGYAGYETTTLQGRGGSFTGFCNQCHNY